MKDKFNRRINYLRISVTDLCNLRCRYCMPEEGLKKRTHREILRNEEIELIARYGAKLGITKIRVTGGEPLVRKGIVDIVGRLGRIACIKDLTMTTNGILLKEMALPLKKAGLMRVNISLDRTRINIKTLRGAEISIMSWRGLKRPGRRNCHLSS